MGSDAGYFRQQADVARRHAAEAPLHLHSDIPTMWLQIAHQFDLLADLTERYGPWRQGYALGPTQFGPTPSRPPFHENDDNDA